jgi:hypothetical protein
MIDPDSLALKSDIPVHQCTTNNDMIQAKHETTKSSQSLAKSSPQTSFWLNKKKVIYFLLIPTLLLIITVGVVLGILLSNKDDRYVINEPGRITYLSTNETKCFNTSSWNQIGAFKNSSCTSSNFNFTHIVHQKKSNSSSIVMTSRSTLTGDSNSSTRQLSFKISTSGRILSLRRIQDSNASDETCSLDDPNCKQYLNRIPVVHIEFEPETNNIKRLEIPKEVPDSEKLELISQASHLHPNLNSSLVKKNDDTEAKPPVITKRGDEIFEGYLSENKREDGAKEVAYSLNSSTKQEVAPVTNEQKTVIDSEKKVIIESTIKESRSLSQEFPVEQSEIYKNATNFTRILGSDLEGMNVSAEHESKTEAVFSEFDPDYSDIISEIKPYQDLEVYTLENITIISDRLSQRKNNHTIESDTKRNEEDDNQNATRILAEGDLIFSERFNLMQKKIFGAVITCQCVITVLEGSGNDMDLLNNRLVLLINGQEIMEIINFQKKIPGSLRTVFCLYMKSKQKTREKISEFKKITGRIKSKLNDHIQAKIKDINQEFIYQFGDVKSFISKNLQQKIDETKDIMNYIESQIQNRTQSLLQKLENSGLENSLMTELAKLSSDLLNLTKIEFDSISKLYSNKLTNLSETIKEHSFLDQKNKDRLLQLLNSAKERYLLVENKTIEWLSIKKENLKTRILGLVEKFFNFINFNKTSSKKFEFLKKARGQIISQLNSTLNKSFSKILDTYNVEIKSKYIIDSFSKLMDTIRTFPIGVQSAKIVNVDKILNDLLAEVINYNYQPFLNVVDQKLAKFWEEIFSKLSSTTSDILSDLFNPTAFSEVLDKSKQFIDSSGKLLTDLESKTVNSVGRFASLATQIMQDSSFVLSDSFRQIQGFFESLKDVSKEITTCFRNEIDSSESIDEYQPDRDVETLDSSLNELDMDENAIPVETSTTSNSQTQNEEYINSINLYYQEFLPLISLQQRISQKGENFEKEQSILKDKSVKVEKSMDIDWKTLKSQYLKNFTKGVVDSLKPLLKNQKALSKDLLINIIKTKLNQMKKEVINKLVGFSFEEKKEWSKVKNIYKFCFPVSVIWVCGDINIFLKYGFSLSGGLNFEGFTTSFTPYINAGVQALAYVEAYVARAGVGLDGNILDVFLPVKLDVNFASRSAGLKAILNYNAFSFKFYGWYQIIEIRCGINHRCWRVFRRRICIPIPWCSITQGPIRELFASGAESGLKGAITILDLKLN